MCGWMCGLQAAEQQVLAWERAAQALRDLAAQQQAEADSIVQRAKQVGSQRCCHCRPTQMPY